MESFSSVKNLIQLKILFISVISNGLANAVINKHSPSLIIYVKQSGFSLKTN